MPIISGGTLQSKHQNEQRQSFTEQTPTTSNSLMKKTPPPTTTEMEQAPPSLTSPWQPPQQQSPSPAGQLMGRQQQDLIMRLFVLTLQPPHWSTQLFTLSANNSTSKWQTGHTSVPLSTTYVAKSYIFTVCYRRFSALRCDTCAFAPTGAHGNSTGNAWQPIAPTSAHGSYHYTPEIINMRKSQAWHRFISCSLSIHLPHFPTLALFAHSPFHTIVYHAI